jgi:hypothetical protein
MNRAAFSLLFKTMRSCDDFIICQTTVRVMTGPVAMDPFMVSPPH